jgi:hypothetical protein
MRQHRLERLPTVDLAEGEADGWRAGEALRVAAEHLDGCMALGSIWLGGEKSSEDLTSASPARLSVLGQRERRLASCTRTLAARPGTSTSIMRLPSCQPSASA